MRYADFQAVRRDLHVRWHAEAPFSHERARIDKAIAGLEQDHTRDYDLNESTRIHVRVVSANLGVSMALQQLGDGFVKCYVAEFWRMTATELRQTADIRELVELYVVGEIAELPPSGPWHKPA